MRQPLILNYYYLLPERLPNLDPDQWERLYRSGLNKFARSVAARYNEATLQRLLSSSDILVRQATVLALGLIGSNAANAILASCLRDDDAAVRDMAAEGMWSLWFRADSPENNQELQRLMAMEVDPANAPHILAGFQALIRKSPRFAEAFNQRAIVYFRLGDFPRAVSDCEKTLRLNPHHFGAASGLAQMFMKQRKFRAALRTYRRAHRIHPYLEGVPETILSLEEMLGEEGKRGS